MQKSAEKLLKTKYFEGTIDEFLEYAHHLDPDNVWMYIDISRYRATKKESILKLIIEMADYFVDTLPENLKKTT